MTSKGKGAEYYRRLPYRRRLRIEEDEGGKEYFVAFIDDLPGVEADGADPAAARAHLMDTFEDYIKAMLEWGEEIPEPQLWPGEDFVAPQKRARRRRGPRKASQQTWETGATQAGGEPAETEKDYAFA